MIKKIIFNFYILRKIMGKEKESIEVVKNGERNKFFTFEKVKIVDSKIGEFTYVSENSIIHNSNIGKFCSIGPNVILGYGEHPLSSISTSPLFYVDMKIFKENFFVKNSFNGKKNITIGNDVWIGANVYIKNGLNIGDGAIIGAGSVVTKSVPAYAIVVGVPAKIIRYRFNEDEIKKLLKIEWWNWSIEKIESNKIYFVNDELTEFFTKHS